MTKDETIKEIEKLIDRAIDTAKVELSQLKVITDLDARFMKFAIERKTMIDTWITNIKTRSPGNKALKNLGNDKKVLWALNERIKQSEVTIKDLSDVAKNILHNLANIKTKVRTDRAEAEIQINAAINAVASIKKELRLLQVLEAEVDKLMKLEKGFSMKAAQAKQLEESLIEESSTKLLIRSKNNRKIK
ncbi:MAG TPA: hypothetical protein VJB66_04065 [Candidatus Nanoarchaeia archaeon]|nr:hypothetical protein [Candidatus Nanoarchaeia archaeon]